MMAIEELKKKANYIRDEVIRVAVKNKAGHIAPSLSTVDILVALYYRIMWPYNSNNFDIPYSILQKNIEWRERDRLVLSKGHGCYALYAILADLGIMSKEVWENFGIKDSVLKGCVEYKPELGLEASTGSLGHGLPMAVGMAYAAKLQNKKYKVYCIVGDGEMQEGTCWEALRFMYEQKLDNLVVIIDENEFMALNRVEKIVRKFMDYIYYFSVDGHDMYEIIQFLSRPSRRIIIAETIKGKGLKCMESVAKFHYRVPTDDELAMGRTYDSKSM